MKFSLPLSAVTILPMALGMATAAADDFLPDGYESADPYATDQSAWEADGTGADWTDFSWDLTSWWQSRFVSEGRRRVEDATFLMTDASASVGPLNLGAWWAQALTETSYNRVDAYADANFNFDAGKLTLDLRRVFYPTGKEDHSWEAGAGFDFNLRTWFTPFARTYYDFDDIGGGFLETGVKAPFRLFQDNLHISPFALLGIDYGYVDEGHNSPELNHFQLGAELRWNVNPRWQIYGNINHSFSLSALDGIEDDDLTWGGTGVRIQF